MTWANRRLDKLDYDIPTPVKAAPISDPAPKPARAKPAPIPEPGSLDVKPKVKEPDPKDGALWVNQISGLEYKWSARERKWRTTGRYPYGSNPMGLLV